MRDDRNFNCGMWDKSTWAGAGCTHSDRLETRDSFKIDGGMRDVTQKMTGYGRYM